MKIEIIRSKKKENIDNIDNIITQFNNIENFSFLRDNYTIFEDPKVTYPDLSIIKIFLLFELDKNKPIAIKGTLKFIEDEGKILFFPIFYKNFTITKNIDKYLYKIQRNRESKYLNDLNDNVEKFPIIFKELQNDNYLPPADSDEWKKFIYPYEFYALLKKELLIEKIFIFGNCDQAIIENVIKIKSTDSRYNNYLSKQNEIISKSDDFKDKFLLIKNKQFTKDSNSQPYKNYKLMILNKNVSKNEFCNANEEIKNINSKISKNLKDISFFNTTKDINKNMFEKDIMNLKHFLGNSIKVHNFYADKLEKIENLLIFNTPRLKKYLMQIKKIEINDLKINNINYFLEIINRNNTIYKNIIRILIDYMNELNFNFDNIDDSDKNNFLEVISSLKKMEKENYLNTNFDEIIEIISNIKINFNSFKNQYDKNFNEFISDFNKKNKDQEENINYEINKKNKELKQLNNKWEKEKNEIKNNQYITKKLNLNKEISELTLKLKNLKFNWKKTLKLQEEKNQKIFNKKISQWQKENVFNNETIKKINYFNNVISENENQLNILLSSSKNFKIIHFEYKINMLFSQDNNDEKNNNESEIDFKNIFTLNHGDYVLLKTIYNIIDDVKKKTIKNDEVLNKIINRKELNQYDKNWIDEKTILKTIPSFSKLDKYQKEAFKLAIDENDPISIIQGPPGTGKTTVITEIIKYYHLQNKYIVISSQTNVAIKNVLEKLADKEMASNSTIAVWKTTNIEENFSETLIHDTWHEKIFNNLKYNNNFKEISNKIDENIKNKNITKDTQILSEFENNYKVIGATTTTSKFINKEIIDVLIIDEISKCILPEILRYALNAKKMIFVGDHKQLSPIFEIKKDSSILINEELKNKTKEVKKIIEKSIFYDLIKTAKLKNRVVTLRTNYRSLPGIIDTYNVFYDKSEKLDPKRKIEEFYKQYNFKNSKYFKNNKNLYFFNITGGNEIQHGASRFNIEEIRAIIRVLDDLCKTLSNSSDKTIAIIFFYASQIYYFKKHLTENNLWLKYEQKFKDIKIDTVDSFQGSEANIVILSTVITDIGKDNFLKDARRINVALSRAKDLLLIFGNERAIKSLIISNTGIKKEKYFSIILKEKTNKYLQINPINFNKGEE